MMNYTVITEGEKLAQFLHDRVLPPFPPKLATTLAHTGRHEELGSFFREIAVVNLACRIVEAGRSRLKELSCNTTDPAFDMVFRGFLRDKLLITPPMLDKLVRFGIRAVDASREHVTFREHAMYKKQFQRTNPTCYMCGRVLDYSETGVVSGFSLDHIWPRRYGGNSVKENLLPACESCNSSKKKGFASWAMTSIQSVVFGFNPKTETLEKMDGQHKFALHYLAARNLANRRNWSLQMAFLRLGPWNEVRVRDESDLGDFFNLVNCESSGLA